MKTQRTKKLAKTSFWQQTAETVGEVFHGGGTFVWLKYIAFICFSVVSLLLSLNMFYQLSDTTLERQILIAVAISIEFLKIYELVRANTLYYMRKKFLAFKAYMLYGVLAILSVSASYGFTLSVVQRSVQKVEITSTSVSLDAKLEEKARLDADLKRLDTEIADYTARIATADREASDWNAKLAAAIAQNMDASSTQYKAIVTQVNRADANRTSISRAATSAIATLTASRTKTNDKLTAITAEIGALSVTRNTEEQAVTSSVTMFALMAEALKPLFKGITEVSLRLYLLLIISILVEAGIISTSPSLVITEKHLKHFVRDFESKGARRFFLDTFMEKVFNKIFPALPPPAPAPESPPPPAATIPQPPKPQVVYAPPPKKAQTPKAPSKEFEPAAKPIDLALEGTFIKAPSTIDTVIARQEEHLKTLEAPEGPSPQEILDFVVETVPTPEPTPLNIVSVAPAKPEEKEIVETVPTRITTPIPDIKMVPTNPEVKKDEAPTFTYRFGKTTEEVKNQFVNFIMTLVPINPGECEDPTAVEQKVGIKKALGKIFLERLMTIKGSKGLPLIAQHLDPKNNLPQLVSNYTREYIINYTTAKKEA